MVCAPRSGVSILSGAGLCRLNHTSMNPTHHTRWANLRSLLHDAPSPSLWSSLVELMASWPAANKDEALDYATGHLARWPDWLRSARDASTLSNPLVRHLNLGWMGATPHPPTDPTLRLALRRANHISALTVSGAQAWQALLTLEPMPHIHSLCLMGVHQADFAAMDPRGERWTSLRRALPSLEHFVWLGAIVFEEVDLRPLGPLRSLRLVGIEVDASTSFLVPEGLDKLELSGFDNALGVTHTLDELGSAPLKSLVLRSNVLTLSCVKAALEVPGLGHLDLTHSALDDDAAHLLEALDVRPPRWTRDPNAPPWLHGAYRFQEDGVEWGGEEALLEFVSRDDGALTFRYEWSGWWASGFDADSDRHIVEGLVYVFDPTHLLLVMHDEDSHFFADTFSQVVFDEDFQGCTILSTEGSPGGHYTGPLNLNLSLTTRLQGDCQDAPTPRD